MNRKISYFILSIALVLTGLFTVDALTQSEIVIDNNNASFSKVYEKLEDAKSAINDFEKYVKDNKGIVLSTKTDEIINQINNEILNGYIEADSLSDLEESVNSLNDYYNDLKDEKVEYEVVYGDIETIENETVDYEYENGEVGTFSDIASAYIVSRMVEAFNNREDYEYRTRIARERRVVRTLVANLNGSFNSVGERDWFLFAYYITGYDLSDVDLSESIVTDTTYETKEFASFDDRDTYIAELEDDGFTVSHELNSIRFDDIEEDVTNIDEDFDSIAGLNDFMRDLDQNYNHQDLNITDNSYDDITDEKIEQDGFETEDEARQFIDSYRNEYNVSNENITSYEDTATEEEDVKKFYTTEEDANNALQSLETSLGNGEQITSSNVRKLSLDEIDMDLVLDSGDTNLSSDNVSYNFFGFDTSTFVRNYRGQMYYGEVNVTSVTVDGVALEKAPGFNRNLYRIQSGRVNNNSKVVVSGEIIYGFSRVNFTAEGILNNLNDNSRDRNIFEYSISQVNISRNGSLTISDNLEDIYELDATIEREVEKTLYKAEADIYSVRRVNSYNLSGVVSNIRRIPVYVVDITKSKDRTVYNTSGIATRDIYGTFYVVYYDAVRTIRDIVLSYKQDFTVIEKVKEVTYLAQGTGKINVEEVAPNTGIDTNSNNYMYLLLGIIPLGYLAVRKFRTE